MSLSDLYPDIRPSLNLDFANTKALDPRITFSRASAAKYYDGVTFAKAEENLLKYSQEFDFVGVWPTSNLTVASDTADTTAPDGTSTAEKFTDDATNQAHRVEQILSGIAANTTYVVSCFLKKGTGDFAYLNFTDASTAERYFAADFDLNNGTVRVTADGSSGTLSSSSITSVGNGWYRCVIIGEVTAVGAMRVRIGVSDGTSSFNSFGNIAYVGTGSTVYAWGAQLEQRSALTDYTATTDQPITNYVPALQSAAAGEARFDHDPVTGESKGLLIEEQRTNLLTYSEQFDNAAWTKTNSSITSNIVVAPDGTLTGDKLVENTVNSAHNVSQQLTTSAGSVTATYYVKAAERSYVQIRFQESGSFLARAEFNLATGEAIAITGTPSITPVGNGWYRISLNATSAGSATFQAQLWLYDSTPVGSYTGDGYSGVYIWGAQLEAGSFPTSYITTTSAQATRNADSASMTGTNFSSWYRQDEGTVFVDGDTTDTIAGFTGVDDGTTLNRIRLFQNTSTTIRGEVHYGGVSQGVISAGVAALGSQSKTAASYKENSFSISTNGATVFEDTSVSIPRVNQLRVGNIDGGAFLNGHIKKLAYYPARLSDQQLQNLTKG